MVRVLLNRIVTPGASAAGYVLWYLNYHVSGGAATRSEHGESR
jgi:hypothetical protein